MGQYGSVKLSKEKVIRKTSTLVEVSSDARTVSVHVKPAVNKQPDRVIVSPMDDVKPTVSDQPTVHRVTYS